MKTIFIFLITSCSILFVQAQNWTLLNPPLGGNFLNSICWGGMNTLYSVGSSGTILKSVDVGDTWVKLTSGTQKRFNSVWFINSDTGVVVGDNGIILKTLNGGLTWEDHSYNDFVFNFPGQGLQSVCFTDANTGYAAGYKVVEEPHGEIVDFGILVKTTDGGINWYSVSQFGDCIFYSLCFPSKTLGFVTGSDRTIGRNNGSGWIYGDHPRGSDLCSVNFPDTLTGYAAATGYVLKTTDGGNSWDSLGTGMHNVSIESLYFTERNTGYACGHSWNTYSDLFKTTDGGISWNTLASGSTNWLNSLVFISRDTGFAVGGGGIILRTTDAGTTWSSRIPGTHEQLNSISFRDTLNGIAVGQYGTIIHSNNGGLTWNAGASGTTKRLMAVLSTEPETAWAVGDSGVILKTTDGGSSWNQSTQVVAERLLAVSFPDINTGYACGYYGRILKTTDGGANWTILPSGISDPFYSVCFPESDTGYVAGYGMLLKTTDGGSSWQQISLDAQEIISLCFFTTKTGYAVSSDGTIHYTTDGGLIWTTRSTVGAGLTAASFIDENTGYAVANNNGIYKTTDGLTWVKEISGTTNQLYSVSFPHKHKAFVCGGGGVILGTSNFTNSINEKKAEVSLFIYPVPSSDLVIVEFSSQISAGTLSVNSLDGKELISKMVEGGKFQLDIQSLPKGVYIVNLLSNDKVTTGKLIKN